MKKTLDIHPAWPTRRHVPFEQSNALAIQNRGSLSGAMPRTILATQFIISIFTVLLFYSFIYCYHCLFFFFPFLFKQIKRIIFFFRKNFKNFSEKFKKEKKNFKKIQLNSFKLE